jgi:hypothetical protein
MRHVVMALIRRLGNRGAEDIAIEEPDADGPKDLVSGDWTFFAAHLCTWHVVAITANKDWVKNTALR